MKRNVKTLTGALMIILFVVQMFGVIAFADTEAPGYTTECFDVDVEITEDYVFHFTETITVDFDEEKHGIYRYITKDDRVYEIDCVKVEDYPYETYNEDEFVIQIGDPDFLVSGKQVYTLHYDIIGFKDKDRNGDMLYLDVLPTGWETPIEEANITIHFPKAFDLKKFQVHFGAYGASGNNGHVQYEFLDDGLTLKLIATDLQKGNGITISAELPEGYWLNAKNHDWLMYVIIVLLIIGIVSSGFYWHKYGRDEEVIKTVEFYAPNQMTPAELAYVVKGSITDEQMSAMILYFADKGYLSIHENGTGQFQLTKEIKKLPKEEKTYARILFNGLFKAGDKISLSELPDGLAKIYEKAEEQLGKVFEQDGKRLFTKKSDDAQLYFGFYHMAIGILPCLVAMIIGVHVFDFSILLLLVLGGSALYGLGCFMDVYDSWAISGTGGRVLNILLAIVILGVNYWMNLKVFYANFHSIWFCIAFVVLSVIFAFFITIMQSRTDTSRKLLGRVLGFRDFIETAELDRLKVMAAENPAYFFHIMPYAFVLGLSDKWTEHFMNQIPVDAPRWYSGNCANPADLYWYNHLASRCMNSISQNIDSKIYDENESNGGGSGGGFFSGGGFGGGGGGSW